MVPIWRTQNAPFTIWYLVDGTDLEEASAADWDDDAAVLAWLESNAAAMDQLLADEEKNAVVAKLKALFDGRSDAEALVAAALK